MRTIALLIYLAALIYIGATIIEAVSTVQSRHVSYLQQL